MNSTTPPPLPAASSYHPHRSHRRGVIEPLEARIAPAAVSWDGGAGTSSWTDANNWSNNLVPTVDDDVTISIAGVAAVSLTTGAQSVKSLLVVGDDSLSISDGSLTLAASSAISNLSMTGSGTLVANATLALTGAGSLSGSVTLGGSGVITNSGTLGIISGEPNVATMLVNSGTITQGNAHLDLVGAAGKLRVVSGGLYETINTGSDFGIRSLSGGLGVSVETGGVFRHNSSNSARFLTASFGAPTFDVLGGTVDVVKGTLGLNGNGAFTNATLTVAVGQAVNFLNAANITVNGTLTGTGGGVVNLHEDGKLVIPIAGATLNFPVGLFQWSANGNILGPGVVTNTGFIQIPSGEPNLETELRNVGTIRQGDAHLDFEGGNGKLRVLAGGLYETVNTGSDFGIRNISGGLGFFVEEGGVFRHNSINGARFLTASFGDPGFHVAGGTLEVTQGTLGINGASDFTNATLIPATGALINILNAGNVTVHGTLTGSGGGRVNLHEDGKLTAPAAGATLNFPAGLFDWSASGNIVGPGVWTNTGFIQIPSGEPNLETELRNVGTIRQANAHFDFEGGTGKLRVLAGGLYETTNTNSDFGLRNISGGLGFFVEEGGVFRHNSFNGARFLTASFGDPGFHVAGGTLEVVQGTLGINGASDFTNATLIPATGQAINILNAGNVTVHGTLTGSGGGRVNLHEDGKLTAPAAGATLNFPVGLFDWSASGNIVGPGVWTNTGFIQIPSGEPNLETELRNVGTIRQANAHFDFEGGTGKLRVLAGGLYETNNTASDFGIRNISGGLGFFVEEGGVFRHNSINGARFLTAAFGDPGFHVAGGTLEVVQGTLGINGASDFTNATLIPATGQAINILNAGNVTVHGTLTGSGGGRVNLHEDGKLTAPAAGATLNFPVGLFDWSASGNIVGPGVWTNTGFIQIPSGEPNLETELRNVGTIRQANAHFDFEGGIGKLRVLAGGLYETVNTGSDFGLRNISGGLGFFVEEGGLFRHNSFNSARFLTAAFGTPSFSNTGTVEVVKGTLFLNGATAQVSSGALTAGEWIVRSGASLNFNAPITSNAAAITVEGTGTLPGFGTLASNTGSLTLRAGADLTTTANFTNSGLLRLGEGSVLTAPNFTQAAAGTLELEVGGTTTADYGRLAITNVATFGGTARVLIASDYSPATGQVLTLANYGSTSGSFANFEGLDLTRTRVFAPFVGPTSLTVSSLVNAANLDAVSITAPASGFAGQDFAISYTVNNTSAFPTFATTWTDTIYLSLDDVLDSSDIVLSRVTHTGAVAGGGSYTENVTVPLTGTLTGSYKVLVLADSRGFVADPDRTNNLVATAGSSTLDIPQLTEGVAVNGTIRAGQQLWYRLTLPAGETPNFTFTGAVAGEAEIYTSFGEVPTRADYLEKGFSQTSTVQRIVADVTAAGTYYVLLHGRESAGAGQSFSLVGDGVGFDLASSSLVRGANVGKVTATLTGSQFSPGTTFTLVPNAGAPRAAEALYFENARTVHATFDLTGLAAGAYDIVATKGLASDVLNDAFTVTSGGTPGLLQFSVSSPSFVRPQGGTVTITYQNVGDTDLDAPLFNLIAENARLRLADDSAFLGATFALPGGQPLTVVELLGVSGGLAGILSPGERGSVELSFQAINSAVGARSKFEVVEIEATNDPVNFSGLKDDLRPDGVRADAWDAIFANFQAEIGGTTAGYLEVLVENANYLGQFGPVSADVTRLLEFELEQAGEFGAIAERYALGALGRGNAAPFSLQATTDANGTVVLSDGLSTRTFFAVSGGGFVGGGTDGATLTRSTGGVLTLTEAAGEKTVFRASDGRVDFVEGANGNRVTAARDSSGQLLTLTDSLSGDVTTFTHNAQGRITSITDAVGRVTTYGYDLGGEHLTSVTTPSGTTALSYTATGHALASFTNPSGVMTSFTYDSRGRVATQTVGTGADALTTSFAYDDIGGLTVTAPGGRETVLFRTLDGSIARTIDPLGNVTSTAYDALGRIVSVTDANGLTTRTGADADGLLAGYQAADRAQTGIVLGGDLLRLQSVTDPGGDISRFAYDTRGNLLSATLPDGTADRFEYDASGRVTASTDANGLRSTFTYDGDGLVTRRAFADGTQIDFTYDAHRNLLTATDAEGATTFTYDAADRITSVAYPNGKSVAITYDNQGRRATVADQTGYTVRYSYDSLSRLDQVRDTANALLVDYGYDALGQLASETRGNGSTTAYAYDGEGRVAAITHRNAANATTAFFNYTYDAQDRVQSVTTAAGATTYTYDLVGQLTGVALPGGRTISYAYDAEGNRVAVTDSAAGAEGYATNVGDQYTTAGEETLTYDREGRLLTRTQGGVTTSYSYDAQGHLIGIAAPGSVTTFDYDALGNRIGKTENGVRTDYANDPLGLGNLFGEYNGATATHYASGFGIAARESAGSTGFYHFDATGNTALISGTGGAAVATYAYLPFGEISAQTGSLAQPFTFNGQLGVQDDPGDLFHMRARAYDAELGRFTSRDPIGFTGGDANLYRYAANDPVNLNDPSGLVLPGAVPVIVGFQSTAPSLVALASSNASLGLNAIRGAFVAGETLAPLVIPAASTAATGGEVVAVTLTGGSAAGLSAASVLGLVGLGAVAGVAGAAGTIGGLQAIDNHFRNNRDADAARLGYPDVNVPHFDADFVREQGKNPYFTEFFQQGIQANKSQDQAILDALTLVRKYNLENERRPGTPNKTESQVVRPSDPNNVIGPAGPGADPVPAVIAPGQFRFDGFVNAEADFGYTIQFENQPSATAPAQVVNVTQTLDADLDFSTFRFTGFGFGNFKIDVPADQDGTSFETIYDGALATLGVLVHVEAELNTVSGLLEVTFTSLDPATNEVPADPFAGFLPANLVAPQGDGFLTYSVAPKAGLPDGREFTAIASIVFDTEDAIATPTVTNTLDDTAPNSAVTAFANATSTRQNIAVRWTAADNAGGSGISGTSIFFTDNDGPLQTLTADDERDAIRFTGEVGHVYKFFSQAFDAVGNEETLGLTPDATITVVAPPLVTATGNKVTLIDDDGDSYTVQLKGPAGAVLKYLQLDEDPNAAVRGPLDFLVVENSTTKHSLSVTVKRAKDGPDADRLPDGDGIVTIGDVIINGSLKAFAAKSSDLDLNGLTATGTVKSLAIRDLLPSDALVADPRITLGGTNVDKTTISARNLADGFTLTTPGIVSAITAGSIGNGKIHATALGKLTTTTGAMNADLDITGAVGPITVRTGVDAGNWSGASFGAIGVNGGAFDADVATPGALAKLTVKGGGVSGQLEARSFGAVVITGGNFSGVLSSTTPATTLGKTAALTSFTVTGGDLAGDVSVLGKIGKVTVKADKLGNGGDLAGDLNAASFGKVTLTGGTLSGTLTAFTPADALRATPALAGLSISGGDLTGDIRVRGAIGAISVLAKTGIGGNITDASVVGAKIAALTAGVSVADSRILAGADLGADYVFGGGDDTFAAGTIGAVRIGVPRGTGPVVINSVIGAGFSTDDAVLKDDDDMIVGATLAEKVASRIASLTINGQADAGSYFIAGKFKAAPKIAGAVIDPANDPLGRFLAA